ncbi:helix-turn-helix transcriptional regulator [Kribbella jiaozuonensis]|uniref:Helix-turn-helix domain-containing protein n=1 Tax=Kribbella jiaozuonensis TaxID=2575441 RepID=A0A4V5UVT1_9ACTN|nr:helix-turn-helix transcriptional regulator [Kribbella jiaozuonensis]TKK74263.1 helix-turn-helix domain-containing protein [Kribbella jiaozuonensis]
MHGSRELRDFLTSRRASLTPEDVGLPPSQTHRRVKGLRREEVAILAGVSVDYYVKLEQGRVGNISEQVLASIEDALRLDELERQHLRSLLSSDSVHPRRRPPLVKARPAALAMINALDPVPAVILGPHLEVLGINHAAKALLDDFDAMPIRERNLARWMFLDPRPKQIYLDWAKIAAETVAILRAAAVAGVCNERLTELVGELSVASPEFVRFWADYRLFEHTHGIKRFFHEAVGEMQLNYQALPLPGDNGQTVIVYTADKGSPSEEKLALLSSWSATPMEPDSAKRVDHQ